MSGLRSVVDPDPHWFGCLGFGSVLGIRIQIQEHGNRLKLPNNPGFLPCFKYIFHVKIQLVVTFNSDQDPDANGSALVWLPGSESALRLIAGVRILIRIETNADTQHWFLDISLVIRKVIYFFIGKNVYFLVNYMYHITGTHGKVRYVSSLFRMVCGFLVYG